MSETSKKLKELRSQLSQVQRRRSSCKGDPEMLRDLDDQARALKDEISRLERR